MDGGCRACYWRRRRSALLRPRSSSPSRIRWKSRYAIVYRRHRRGPSSSSTRGLYRNLHKAASWCPMDPRGTWATFPTQSHSERRENLSRVYQWANAMRLNELQPEILGTAQASRQERSHQATYCWFRATPESIRGAPSRPTSVAAIRSRIENGVERCVGSYLSCWQVLRCYGTQRGLPGHGPTETTTDGLRVRTEQAVR